MRNTIATVLASVTAGTIISACTYSPAAVPGFQQNGEGPNVGKMSSGWQISDYAAVKYPGAVAAAGAGFVYVASYKTNKVTGIAPDGSQVKIGSGFRSPNGVAAYNGYVYVADSQNSAVKKVSPDGVITEVGSGWGEPFGIDTDSAGNLYVTDILDGAVTKVTPKGRMTRILDQSECEYPIAVAVDSSNNVYVICQTKGIVKVTPGGMISEVGSGWMNPVGITVDAKSNLYVTQRKDGLFEYSATDQLEHIATNKQIPNAMGVAFRNGALYVSSFAKNKIVKLTQQP